MLVSPMHPLLIHFVSHQHDTDYFTKSASEAVLLSSGLASPSVQLLPNLLHQQSHSQPVVVVEIYHIFAQ
jgi:hypothetical protein